MDQDGTHGMRHLSLGFVFGFDQEFHSIQDLVPDSKSLYPRPLLSTLRFKSGSILFHVPYWPEPTVRDTFKNCIFWIVSRIVTKKKQTARQAASCTLEQKSN